MGLFCKKTFFFPLPFPLQSFHSRSIASHNAREAPAGRKKSSPRCQPWVGKAALDQPRKGRKKETLNLPNALRPDCPSRKFRGQQNSSEHSESTEETESTEGTESGRAGIPACLLSVQAAKACMPFATSGANLTAFGQSVILLLYPWSHGYFWIGQITTVHFLRIQEACREGFCGCFGFRHSS